MTFYVLLRYAEASEVRQSPEKSANGAVVKPLDVPQTAPIRHLPINVRESIRTGDSSETRRSGTHEAVRVPSLLAMHHYDSENSVPTPRILMLA